MQNLLRLTPICHEVKGAYILPKWPPNHQRQIRISSSDWYLRKMQDFLLLQICKHPNCKVGNVARILILILKNTFGYTIYTIDMKLVILHYWEWNFFGLKESFQNIRGKKSNIHFNEIGNCLRVQNVLN